MTGPNTSGTDVGTNGAGVAAGRVFHTRIPWRAGCPSTWAGGPAVGHRAGIHTGSAGTKRTARTATRSWNISTPTGAPTTLGPRTLH